MVRAYPMIPGVLEVREVLAAQGWESTIVDVAGFASLAGSTLAGFAVFAAD